MGQYHFVANLDKREFLSAHAFGEGIKLLEFGGDGNGVMLGLALLLAVSNRDDTPDGPFKGNRGGGDFHVWADPYGDGRDVGDVTKKDHQLAKAIIGRWGGDRIAIIGDYAEDDDIPSETGQAHWNAADPRDNPWAPNDDTDASGRNSFWTDISASVYRVMKLDYYTRQDLDEREAASEWTKSQVSEGDPYAILKKKKVATSD